jgi:hypothetical protein
LGGAANPEMGEVPLNSLLIPFFLCELDQAAANLPARWAEMSERGERISAHRIVCLRSPKGFSEASQTRCYVKYCPIISIFMFPNGL